MFKGVLGSSALLPPSPLAKDWKAIRKRGAPAQACDCFLLSNVRTAAEQLEGPWDVVVLSQGMATIQGFTPTAEGLDEKLALHYWSRAAFLIGLLPRLAGDARVLTVLSAGVTEGSALRSPCLVSL